MRLVDADGVIRKLRDEIDAIAAGVLIIPFPRLVCKLIQNVIDHLQNTPTIEATPVVHGRWEDKPTGRYGQQQSWCSACGKHSGIGGIESNRHRAFCPNCGARMDGGSHG